MICKYLVLDLTNMNDLHPLDVVGRGSMKRVNPFPLSYLTYLNFHPHEVVSLYSYPKLQIGENYLYLFNLKPNICKSWCLSTHFIPNNWDLT